MSYLNVSGRSRAFISLFSCLERLCTKFLSLKLRQQAGSPESPFNVRLPSGCQPADLCQGSRQAVIFMDR